MREALLAVLSTAASMGIDLDLLGHLAAEELLDERLMNDRCGPMGDMSTAKTTLHGADVPGACMLAIE